MNHTLRIILLLLFFAVMSMVVHAQEKPFEVAKPESVKMSSDSLQKMNAHFHNLVDQRQLAGIQTAIVRNGKLIHFDSYGYANLEEKKILNKQSIFRIFSMTKPIVSVALMQLYEQGKFKLEDPLHKYLPAFKEMQVYTDSTLILAKNPIRIIDLLRHTSGFSYGRTQHAKLNQIYAEANLYSSQNNKEFVAKLSKLPLSFEPGTDWQYGLSTNICGHLVEVLSGKSLKTYLKDHIFTPLGMNNTYFQLPKEKIEHFTVGYRWQAETGLFVSESQRNNSYTQEVSLYNGGGGLVSTTIDYLKFCQMLLQEGTFNAHVILQKETVKLILKDHLQEVRQHQERFRLPLGEYGFGFGFAIRGTSETELDNIFGWGGAVGTYFKIDTDHNIAYVMMIQLSPYRHLGLRHLFQQYVKSATLK
ncbi:serine hydrolase [uncultured Kordia sp.]|uniref:serine hydrolase domain-containing protein n=1 Tax=uncultured Kordia sp. TaxID=507699 RepID=UPI00262A602F|nr:serine hydrolase domain-containing protein [uncultured Kordia sp.]